MKTRLNRVVKKAVEMNLRGGQYELDEYNNIVVTDGISFTITTRISASNHYYVLEIDE